MDISYLIYPMIMSNIDKMIDNWIFIIPIFIIISIIKNPMLINNITDIYEDYFCRIPKGTITLESTPDLGKNSIRYQAIMWYLSNNINDTIYKSHEVFYKKYNYSREVNESKHFFRIDQKRHFKVSEDIYGRVFTVEKDVRTYDHSNSNFSKELNYNITLYSYKLNVNKLILFLDNLIEEHKSYQIQKNLKRPIIIETKFNTKKDEFDYYYYDWDSNVSFDNKFFENKDKILEQIDFFLENPEYFEKKGIPYQLGILLHGIPGCGKTSFIKALAKKTNRHIIDIKLNNNINLSELKHLFLEEELTENLVIPINKRLYVLEDIDVMGDIVHKRKTKLNTDLKTKKDRDIKNCNLKVDSIENDSSNIIDKNDNFDNIDESKDMGNEFLKLIGTMSGVSNKPEDNNNNMSYMLNILDGIQENKGRIIIMTTNHIEKIDPAIIRPGRIDININFRPANKRIIEEILGHYWDMDVCLDFEVEDIPHCKIIELCRSSSNIEETIKSLQERKYR